MAINNMIKQYSYIGDKYLGKILPSSGFVLNTLEKSYSERRKQLHGIRS